MKRYALIAAAIAALTLTPMLQDGRVLADSVPSKDKRAFGFNASNISGFSTFSAEITGGGAYDLGAGFVNSAGGFRCLSDISASGNPFDGCKAGEGVRWDTSSLLASTKFKCSPSESAATLAQTSSDTVVLASDFY